MSYNKGPRIGEHVFSEERARDGRLGYGRIVRLDYNNFPPDVIVAFGAEHDWICWEEFEGNWEEKPDRWVLACDDYIPPYTLDVRQHFDRAFKGTHPAKSWNHNLGKMEELLKYLPEEDRRNEIVRRLKDGQTVAVSFLDQIVSHPRDYSLCEPFPEISLET